MPAPIRNEDAEYVTIGIAMKKLNLCRASILRIARESNSLFRFGKVQRINWEKFSKYFMENYAEKKEGE